MTKDRTTQSLATEDLVVNDRGEIISIHTRQAKRRAPRGSNAKQSRLPRIFLAGTEKALSRRGEVAKARVDVVRAAHPNWDEIRIAKRIQKQYLASVTLVGAGAGGTAAIPGVGLLTGTATLTADVLWFGWSSARMILDLAALHNVDISDPDIRRLHVLSLLAGDEMAVAAATRIGLGAERIGTIAIRTMNNRLTRMVLTRFGTRVVAGRMATLVPFGVGALAGGGVNFVLARDLSRRTQDTFAHISPLVGTSRIVDLSASNRSRTSLTA